MIYRTTYKGRDNLDLVSNTFVLDGIYIKNNDIYHMLLRSM